MNQASIWQVLFIGLCLVLVAYAISRMAREHHAAKLRAAAPREPEHIAVMRAQRDDARLRQVEFEAHAEYASALASMYRQRADRLDEDLGTRSEEAASIEVDPVGITAQRREDFAKEWKAAGREKTPAACF